MHLSVKYSIAHSATRAGRSNLANNLQIYMHSPELQSSRYTEVGSGGCHYSTEWNGGMEWNGMVE
jgi:hypothetical protein